ncbi:ATP-binding protein [Streptomyces albus]|uniref:ATP-binding protein n=1 Tax=Streptomyces albus TaxID=1888 RepID=UPI0007C822E7|nr:ATP-binding protein [Streptomyces albus]QID34322.1 ATP-binding protein [Streptomyces albus]
MDSAAPHAPVTGEYPFSLPASSPALRQARIKGRTALTILGWPGSVPDAIHVLNVLVENALQHGVGPAEPAPLAVFLRITVARELIIEVSDPNPAFRHFAQAVDGELGRGLGQAKQLGATITWFLRPGQPGKTVRALLTPGPVAP